MLSYNHQSSKVVLIWRKDSKNTDTARGSTRKTWAMSSWVRWLSRLTIQRLLWSATQKSIREVSPADKKPLSPSSGRSRSCSFECRRSSTRTAGWGSWWWTRSTTTWALPRSARRTCPVSSRRWFSSLMCKKELKVKRQRQNRMRKREPAPESLQSQLLLQYRTRVTRQWTHLTLEIRSAGTGLLKRWPRG